MCDLEGQLRIVAIEQALELGVAVLGAAEAVVDLPQAEVEAGVALGLVADREEHLLRGREQGAALLAGGGVGAAELDEAVRERGGDDGAVAEVLLAQRLEARDRSRAAARATRGRCPAPRSFFAASSRSFSAGSMLPALASAMAASSKPRARAGELALRLLERGEPLGEQIAEDAVRALAGRRRPPRTSARSCWAAAVIRPGGRRARRAWRAPPLTSPRCRRSSASATASSWSPGTRASAAASGFSSPCSMSDRVRGVGVVRLLQPLAGARAGVAADRACLSAAAANAWTSRSASIHSEGASPKPSMMLPAA